MQPPAPAALPRLVVMIVIDQWPEWSFEAKREALVARDGGFHELLATGYWQIGEHPSAATLTAPGHTLLGSGVPSAKSGVLANEWYHRDLGKRLSSVEDPAGGPPSARWSKVSGIADSIAAAKTGGKAVAISLKERSAILSLGHAGLPIWYDRKAVAWKSQQLPDWLVAYNATDAIKSKIHQTWEPLDRGTLEKLAGPIADDSRGELGEKKFGATFPHVPDQTGDAGDALFATPNGNTVVFDAAIAAIEGEHLGADAAGDLLVLSLSAHDYVGHGWGHESWEQWDAELRLDRDLERFIAYLVRTRGYDWVMIATSDHGASPLPERTTDGGGRIEFEAIQKVAEAAAETVLGPGKWIADTKYPTIFLTAELLAHADKDKAIAAVTTAVRAMPGMAWVEPTTKYAGNCETRAGDDAAICWMLDPERSGELVYMPKPHWILQEADEPVGTAHGSIHDYDRRVPLIVVGPGHVPHALQTAPDGVASMTAIAPMLAAWLGVPAPSTLPR